MDSDSMTKKDLKELSIDDYKYFSRRYELVSMAFIGFCVYGDVEILKWLLANNIYNVVLLVMLFFSMIIFIIILLFIWHNLQLETKIREEYFSLLLKETSKTEITRANYQSLELENKLQKIRSRIFITTILAITISLIVLIAAICLKA